MSEEDGTAVTVEFSPILNGNIGTRASIGDASGIDRLRFAVYEIKGGTPSLEYHNTTEDWNPSSSLGITLLKGKKYKIIFWAENSNNTAYDFNPDNGIISADYSQYMDGGFAKMEQLDAFYAVSDIESAATTTKTIILSRPVAQLNFADNTQPPVSGTHKTEVTYTGIPTGFNLLTGSIESYSSELVTFTFDDYPSEVLDIESTPYYYVATNYIFAPTSISASVELKTADGSATINSFEFTGNGAITLEKNMKTNVLGSIVQQPQQWSVWDGTIPAEHTLTVDSENRYIIDEAADIAWLSVADNTNTLESDRTFYLTTDIDMAAKSGLAPIFLPENSIVEGNDHTIKGVMMSGALFGDATSLQVKNLTIEDAIIGGSNLRNLVHSGILVNTLKGSSSFSNVTISNSSVTTASGAAGGMVGYIVRTSEKDRTETLNVSFNGCKLNNVQISGESSEGIFVGLLSGYDNNETLAFDSACEAVDVTVHDFDSPYTKANNSVWITADVTDKYDGWLGNETYRRAKVTFAGVRLAPKWDGITAIAKADLLLFNGDENEYEVYSPFDLAGIRNATPSPAALYLMENVDMFGEGIDGKFNIPSNWTQSAYVSEDDNYFKSFSTITHLDGNNFGIYNLNINTQKVSNSLYYGGFIQSTSGTTTHKNIKFYNSCVVVPHVVYKNEDKGSAGMLVSNIAGDSYTMDNVHTYGCKIFALQKVGGIAARVAATNSTISNCSVNNGYIENYKWTEHKENFSKSAMGITVSASFYSYGEVGGMFGFVEQNTTITGCKVIATNIYAFGQDDIKATLSGNSVLTYLASKAGLYKVPGRHIGTFIGDVRTTASGGGEIIISECSVDSDSKCLNNQHKHNNKCETIGLAYYLNFSDDKGTVEYNGTKLTLMNCLTNQTSRNQ